MLAQLIAQELELQNKINQNKEDHERAQQKLLQQLTETRRRKSLITNNRNLEIVLLAESVLNVEHWYNVSSQREPKSSYGEGESKNVLRKAINTFATNPEVFKQSYYGTKDYDRFIGQDISPTPYGLGPRHGSVVFRIGMRPEARKRDLTSDEVNAIIYYLETESFMIRPKEQV